MNNDTTETIKITFVNIELSERWAHFRLETRKRWRLLPDWLTKRCQSLMVEKWVYLSEAVSDE